MEKQNVNFMAINISSPQSLANWTDSVNQERTPETSIIGGSLLLFWGGGFLVVFFLNYLHLMSSSSIFI